MKMAISLVLFGLLGCTGDSPDVERMPIDFVYRSFPVEGSYGELRISAAIDAVTMGDIESRLNDCSTEALKLCISSDLLTLALPSNSMMGSNEWAVGSTAFVYDGVSEESILGQRIRVHSVVAKSSSSVARFYFSEQRGLVAVASGIGNTILVSVNSCGLWASSDCQ